MLSLFTAVSSAKVGAQAALPTLDQVLDKYIAASGGRAALEKITSSQAKGTIDIPDANLSGTIELIQKAPNLASTVVELPGVGRQRDVFDGTTGWTEDPMNGVRDKSGLELAESKRAAVFGRELKLKTLYQTMTVKGREQVGGRDAIVVEAVPAEGSPVKMSFDAENGLLVKQTGTRQTPQGPLEVTVTLENYRAVDGVQHAFTIRQSTSMFTAVIQLNEIKHNVPIDDAVFKKS
jgi:outer membrane lipoprotein-sorting protein